MLAATSRRSTFTDGMRNPSITMVTTTRPGPAFAVVGRFCRGLLLEHRRLESKRPRDLFMDAAPADQRENDQGHGETPGLPY